MLVLEVHQLGHIPLFLDLASFNFNQINHVREELIGYQVLTVFNREEFQFIDTAQWFSIQIDYLDFVL